MCAARRRARDKYDYFGISLISEGIIETYIHTGQKGKQTNRYHQDHRHFFHHSPIAD